MDRRGLVTYPDVVLGLRSSQATFEVSCSRRALRERERERETHVLWSKNKTRKLHFKGERLHTWNLTQDGCWIHRHFLPLIRVGIWKQRSICSLPPRVDAGKVKPWDGFCFFRGRLARDRCFLFLLILFFFLCGFCSSFFYVFVFLLAAGGRIPGSLKNCPAPKIQRTSEPLAQAAAAVAVAFAGRRDGRPSSDGRKLLRQPELERDRSSKNTRGFLCFCLLC